MRSTAQFKSHPLHPILIAFPVAFTTAAPAFDLVGVLAEWPTVWAAGAYLATAAVIAGVVAGVPGFIDYLYTVPPGSSAKKRATWHMAVNLAGGGQNWFSLMGVGSSEGRATGFNSQAFWLPMPYDGMLNVSHAGGTFTSGANAGEVEIHGYMPGYMPGSV